MGIEIIKAQQTGTDAQTPTAASATTQDNYTANAAKVYDVADIPDHEINVIEIFFAKKTLVPVYDETDGEIVAKKGETEQAIRKRFIKTNHLAKEETIISCTPDKPFARAATGGEKIAVKYLKRGKDKIVFVPVSKTRIRKKIWVVAVCNAKSGSLIIELKESLPENATAVYDDPVNFLEGGTQKNKLEIDLSKDKIELPNFYAKEITLQPQSEQDLEALVGKFDKRTDKKAFIYLKATATGSEGDIIKYANNEQDFLNTTGKQLEVLGTLCYCSKKLTVADLESIILKLREIDKVPSKTLFAASNCKLPAADKTFDRLYEELSKIFTKYNIDRCGRIAHFLSQACHETDRFQTTLEYATKKDYSPYTGRGLMQLTWKSNYKIFATYSGLDCVTDYNLISENLANAVKSAGWFWHEGKVLGDDAQWSASSKAPAYVKKYNASYPKKRISYKYKKESGAYGTIDMNTIADDDYGDLISWMVNGGANGLQERRDYLAKLKEIFDYDNCINKK